jgi:hypothetical protein
VETPTIPTPVTPEPDMMAGFQSVIDHQSEELKELSSLLRTQQELLSKIIQNQHATPRQLGISNISTEDDLPTLEDVDIPVLSTEGITIEQKADGFNTVSGEDIRDKIRKLKKMKRGGP